MELAELLILVVFLCYLGGLLTAMYAIMNMRSAQGASAWVVGLLLFPFLAIPLYWIFQRNKFKGYVSARRSGNQALRDLIDESALAYATEYRVAEDDGYHPALKAMETISLQPLTGHNHLDLLIDGEATFESMFAAMDEARDYLLVQFYIVGEDGIGCELRDRMIRYARNGIRVYFIYDEIGSSISEDYIKRLQDAGVEVNPFKAVGRGKLHVNFRNHRKIVVVDGHTTFLGGMNVADMHLSRKPSMSPWRDTHMKIVGPAAQAAQLVFLEDWYWGAGEMPKLNWRPTPADGRDSRVLVLPSGPADDLETCSLFFHHLITSARRRLWITSPYFVPDRAVQMALQLAALRGVDVRILIPRISDSVLVKFAVHAFIPDFVPVGVKLYWYRSGFVHQKVMLVDDDLATVGTANLDNRSLRLNFEVIALVADENFAREVEAMLARDFENADPVPVHDYDGRNIGFRLLAKSARLLAPIL